jgi:hypothetical protein
MTPGESITTILKQPATLMTAGILGVALAIYFATKKTKAPGAAGTSGFAGLKRSKFGKAARKCSAATRRKGGGRKAFLGCMSRELGGSSRPTARRKKGKKSRKRGKRRG